MKNSDEEIAVVGIGCNFPGGEGLDNFWKILLEGKNCAVSIPDDRFDSTYWYDPDDSKPGKTRTAKAALIDRFNEFDHKFFSITEAEADFMDPQQKLLLECSYRALENAGIPMEKASGTRTGVFIGLMNRDYETLLNNSPSTITHYNGTGTAMSIAANRISYTFNLTGPSFTIDSACSSSLVALHCATHAIKQGDCEMALCGGVSCIIEPRVFVALSKAKMISPEGTSQPFSSKADGYGRGEGCGIVLLKPLKKALKDYDHVWGVITRTAVNQDGRSVTPITRPSMVQQEELLRSIYSTHIDPSHVQYIEAHGTGTPAGDPTEAGSISKVIAKARASGLEPLYIGSVKGNIGHTESAAGVAGLIKVLLMMHHETMVPSLFYSEDSASIDTKALNLKIPTRAERWEMSRAVGRIAGINSFGFGGTNAHVVVSQCMQTHVSKSFIRDSPKLLVLSAASEKSIAMAITDTSQRLHKFETSDLQALVYTSACRRSHAQHKYRKVLKVSCLTNLQEQLKIALVKKIVPSKLNPKLVFVFCGNGVTYRGMCKHLIKKEPVFREKVKEIEELFQKYNTWNISQKLEDYYDNDDYSKPDVVQPLLFAIQVAIVSLLKHWGIRPDAIIGHSVGEVAAAHCSGLLSLEDAVKVIFFRSTLQSKVTGGKMLVVSNIAVSEILKLLSAYSGKVCFAAFNSPLSCTLSGATDAIRSLHQKLKTSFNSKNLFLHVLDVPAAYHSYLMDSILVQIEEKIGILQGNGMEAELFSTVTGEVFTEGDFCTGKYWARNVRQPVAFEQAVRSAAKENKNTVFVEIGPRRALQRNIMETLGNDTTVLSSVQPDKDHETLLTVVSNLFELGVQVDWEQFYKGYEAPPTPFPTYTFDCPKKVVQFEAVRRGNEMTVHSHHPLLIQNKQDREELVCNLSLDAASYIWEHKHNGAAVVPGSVYVELALASFMANLNPKTQLCLLQLSIHFQSPFVLGRTAPKLKVKIDRGKTKGKFKIFSQLATYASGTIDCYSGAQGKSGLEERYISLDVIFKRCKSIITHEQVYAILSQVGFQYGPIFKHLGNVNYGKEFKEAVSAIKVPQNLLSKLHEYSIHPVVLDYFLQMTAVAAVNGFRLRPGFPSAIGCVTVSGPLLEEMFMYLRTTMEAPDCLEVCGCFTNKGGQVLLELRCVRITFLGELSKMLKECFFHNELHATCEDVNRIHKPTALVFEDQVGVAKALQKHLHPKSTFISYIDSEEWSSPKDPFMLSRFSVPDTEWGFEDVLFMWGLRNLSQLKTEMVLKHLVDCCELFRQVVLKLKKDWRSKTIRVLTYRSAGKTVDHISSGFVLSGMARSCAAEIPGVSFQLIDLESVSDEDIRALAHVIYSYDSCKYPEVMISKGEIYSNVITRTPLKNSPERKSFASKSEQFVLQTADPYCMMSLSAIPFSGFDDHVNDRMVEIQLGKFCVHSSDYFPVSVSELTFGQSLYWNKQASHNHKLLAVDFSGTVTAVGRNVRKLKVGDHVASCYPVAASSKVVIPEAVCYSTKKLAFLKEVPCVSYFVLSFEILKQALPKAKHLRKLGIISSDPASSLLQVLVHAANKSGWIPVVGTEFSGLLHNVNKCDALVLLPPFDACSFAKVFSISTVKHIVLLCDNQGLASLPESIFKSKNENVHIQTLQMANIFQKVTLKKQKAKIYNWLKSMHLHDKCFDNKIITFQRIATENPDSDHPALNPSESYFCTKAMSVVVLDNDTKDMMSGIPLLVNPRQLFQKNSVYIVTGGLSGLGLETVKFIAERGGDCIATLSRRSLSPEMQLQINVIQAQFGMSVICLQCDVSVSEQVMRAVTVIRQRFPSCQIRGVFHSAVVLHDGLLETLNKSLYEKVLRPKVNGVLNLHNATMNCELDYFVCYSSISSFIGNASQSNYAAANSFLDLFCHYRRNLGLAGQSINWGALNLGLLLNKEHFQRFLEARGMMVMDVTEIHESLEHCLLLNNPQQVVCKFNFKNLTKHILSQNTSFKARLSALVEEEMNNTSVTQSTIQNHVSPSSPDEYVRSALSETCNVDLDDLNDDTALFALGIDSMLAMTLQNLIFQERGVNVPLVKILDPNSTLSTLVSVLNEVSVGNFLEK